MAIVEEVAGPGTESRQAQPSATDPGPSNGRSAGQPIATTGEATTSAATPLLRDRYEPKELVGMGRRGKLVRAWDHLHGRSVALKLVDAGTETARQAVLEEARVLLSLRPHPSLPLVREDFLTEGRYVVVMDWIEGSSLEQVLAERGDPGLVPSTVLGLLEPIAAALDHLHIHRPPIVHGDVKPANVIVTPENRVVLVDFGLAGSQGPVAGGGTHAFRAPEVKEGRAPTPAADVYGLAATALTLLAGAPPSGAVTTWEEVAAGIPGALRRPLLRALSSDPGQRPGSGGELLERLRSSLQGALPTGMVTFCLTDIEGSTGLWDVNPSAMAGALAQHDALVAELVESAGGYLIKAQGEGDSTLSVFPRASQAARFALRLQEALAEREWVGGLKLRVRAALHCGEAELREGDYFGVTVNRAARLRSLAKGGQTLLSRAAADLIRDTLPPSAVLVPMGERELRGLSRPEEVFELIRPQRQDRTGKGRRAVAAGQAPSSASQGADSLQAGREAFGRRAWEEAFQLLAAADSGGRLAARDLDALAEAALWTGRFEDALGARQRAHAAHLRVGDRRGAALSAVILAMQHACRLNYSIAGGWLGKAGRFLEGEAQGIEHGYYAVAMSTVLLGAGDLEGAREQARSTIRLGERFGDLDLQALGINYEGYALLKQGWVREAMDLLDESMVWAAAGELGPLASVLVYCHTICACLDVFDYQRAAEWAEAASRCLNECGASEWVSADCHVHKASLLKVRGDWEGGELEARKGSAEMTDRWLDHVGMAWYEIGEFRRLRGDLNAAEGAYLRAYELGATVQPGFALLRLAQGKVPTALASIKGALADRSLDPLTRARLLPANVEIALVVGDIETARRAADELGEIANQYETTPLQAAAVCAQGAMRLAEEDAVGAIVELRRGARLWQQVGAPYERARARLLLARAMYASGDMEAGALELGAARSTLQRLGAVHEADGPNQFASSSGPIRRDRQPGTDDR